MEKQSLSIIIPNRNGGRTIGACLDAIYAINDDCSEVVVVDDCSEDGSPGLIRKFPCRLVQLTKHSGAGTARNAGAMNATGGILFFIDADCILEEDTLDRVRQELGGRPGNTVLGGTYSPTPYDGGFYSRFQAAFINYSETKDPAHPDYLATHALAIHAETFRKTGGFRENFLPILEDVEFSHRLRRAGYRLVMDPDCRVRHIFNFTLLRSLRNAVRKTRYWVLYSLMNRDLFADSGAASKEIKINGVAWMASAALAAVWFLTGQRWTLMVLPVLWGANLFFQVRLFRAFIKAGGNAFAVMASLYYCLIYPAAVWAGAISGVMRYIFRKVNEPRDILPA